MNYIVPIIGIIVIWSFWRRFYGIVFSLVLAFLLSTLKVFQQYFLVWDLFVGTEVAPAPLLFFSAVLVFGIVIDTVIYFWRRQRIV